MVQILIIDKLGTINYSTISNINELYKKCGFRKTEDFIMIHTWTCNTDKNITIELWGRIVGKGAVKNIYNFPNLVEKNIYGNCALIAKNSNYIDLTIEFWEDYCNMSSLNKITDLSDQIEDLSNEVEELKKLSLNTDKVVSDDSSDDISYSDETCSESSDEEDAYNSELKPESYIYSSEEENIS